MSLMMIRPGPFDLKTLLFAKHAQHVVLIHFPIALFVTAVVFDAMAHWSDRRGLADAAYFNMLAATISTLPVIATGIAAWQLQLEGQKLKGALLLHLTFGSIASFLIWLTWWLHFRSRRGKHDLPRYRFAVEASAVFVLMLTGHLGGFLSGVNGPG